MQLHYCLVKLVVSSLKRTAASENQIYFKAVEKNLM